MLKVLKDAVSRQNTSQTIVQAVALFVDEAESVTIEVLQYVMLKVIPKICKSHDFQDEFPSVFELACLKT